MILLIATALVLAILFSAFLSAAELAVFAPGDSRVRALAEEGVRGAGSLSQLRARPDRVLVLLRLGDAFADVAAGSLTTYLAYQLWGVGGVAIAIAVVALLIVYFGELLPIGLAANRGLPFALALAPTLLVLTRVLAVPLAFLAKVARIRVERRGGTAGAVTETDIREMTALGHTEGAIEEHERELIERAFRLDDTKTWDIMTPRVDIFAWRDSLRLQDIASSLGTVQYSRVPVYCESVDDITGVLYVRDAYQALLSGQRDVPLRALAREPLIVPGSVALTKLLRDFQNRRIHLAIVVDEYGGTDGLVTLEDVIEELVGEIEDETDVSEEPITRVSRHEIIAVGDVDLREVNHFFNTTLPQLEHRSLNGYLLEELGRVPEAGEKLERDGIAIEVLDATETQVTRVRMRRATPPREPSLPGRVGDGKAAGKAPPGAPRAGEAAERERE